ncbi:hypothetical protein CEXT_274171 [Caerostris extrusa]|uniref:Uncharacterized protein n=1 Tax=Caerostris extrusa TaxID=172846 RepID=A0AAV4VGA0_CAEEX|nr:hypothetical protein CEXT_274171 [Caerostris extrusa]
MGFLLAHTLQPHKTSKECCSVTKAPIKRSEEHKCQEIRARQTCPAERWKRALCGSQSECLVDPEFYQFLSDFFPLSRKTSYRFYIVRKGPEWPSG